MTVLPDVLKTKLKVVFCGTAAGTTSGRLQYYYAKPSNRFWEVLSRTGFTRSRLSPYEYGKLLDFGIGLTDLSKSSQGSDRNVSKEELEIESFRSKILSYAPKAVAFNGKKAGKLYLNHEVSYGRQFERIGNTVLFVLPSTSGAAARYWNESYWRELAEFVGLE
mgnify:CR=1 FL=1